MAPGTVQQQQQQYARSANRKATNSTKESWGATPDTDEPSQTESKPNPPWPGLTSNLGETSALLASLRDILIERHGMNPAGGSNQNQQTNHIVLADLPRTTTPLQDSKPSISTSTRTTGFGIFGEQRESYIFTLPRRIDFQRIVQYETQSRAPSPHRFVPSRRRTGVRHVEKPVAQLDDGGFVYKTEFHASREGNFSISYTLKRAILTLFIENVLSNLPFLPTILNYIARRVCVGEAT
ncbi:hypothetical protein Landi51_00088 [Colletotrichum acutatum]